MAKRNTNTNTANTAPAKAAQTLRAAALVAKHGLAAMPRIVAVTGNAAASVKRYGKNTNTLNAAFAAQAIGLTATGRNAVALQGCIGVNGAPTVHGLIAVGIANAIAANGGNTATGAQCVTAILGNAALVAALQGTKAKGQHLTNATPIGPRWVQGYIVSGALTGKAGTAYRA